MPLAIGWGHFAVYREVRKLDFNELLQSLINPGEDGPSPTIYDDLSAAYTNDTSTRDAKIETTNMELEALKLELLQAKAANWDLMQSIPSVENPEDNGDNGGEPESSDEESDDIGDDEDFFESDDKEDK